MTRRGPRLKLAIQTPGGLVACSTDPKTLKRISRSGLQPGMSLKALETKGQCVEGQTYLTGRDDQGFYLIHAQFSGFNERLQ